MCEKRVRARVAGMDINSVGACRKGDPILVYRRAAAKLGMEIGKEYLLVATEVESTWPVVIVREPAGGLQRRCGACSRFLNYTSDLYPKRCQFCGVHLVGEISQAEVAAMLRREGGGG